MNEIGRLLLLFGIILVAVGLIFIFADKIPYWGRLPGDFLVRRKNFSVYVPLATCILLSILLTLVLNLFLKK